MNEKIPKNPKTYNCEVCGIETRNKKDYNKHLMTAKHKNRTNMGFLEQINFVCKKCNKIYKARNSLWYHEKICVNELDESNETPPIIKMKDDESIKILTNLVLEIVKNNSELQKQTNDMQKQSNELQKQNIELNKQVLQNIQPSTIHNNSHNKTFNLQFFLNETCKDAMNIMDFVDSFTLQLSDLEDVSKQGYVDGISGIIMKKLNELDVHKRPIHCSDAKREIMYVKDENRWEKEEPGYTKLRKAIKYISKKNSDLLSKWSEAHPASKNITTQTNTEYMQMIVQAMGGRGEIGENENKIIKKIAKTVLIEK